VVVVVVVAVDVDALVVVVGMVSATTAAEKVPADAKPRANRST
jgi:hypothetical protein